MKLIIAGSRNITDYKILLKAIKESGFKPTTIISGTARGVDRLGEMYAQVKGLELLKFPANWNTYGKQAGYYRNLEMSEHGDCLLAIWDGKSVGTKMMIDIAKRKGLDTYIKYKD